MEENPRIHIRKYRIDLVLRYMCEMTLKRIVSLISLHDTMYAESYVIMLRDNISQIYDQCMEQH